MLYDRYIFILLISFCIKRSWLTGNDYNRVVCLVWLYQGFDHQHLIGTKQKDERRTWHVWNLKHNKLGACLVDERNYLLVVFSSSLFPHHVVIIRCIIDKFIQEFQSIQVCLTSNGSWKLHTKAGQCLPVELSTVIYACFPWNIESELCPHTVGVIQACSSACALKSLLIASHAHAVIHKICPSVHMFVTFSRVKWRRTRFQTKKVVSHTIVQKWTQRTF